MIHEHTSSHHHRHQLPKYGITGSATGVARASKKNKPKKTPQRGLGVAQLEKLRLEEQKKIEGGNFLPLHHPQPPVPLSAFPRPPADCVFSPVLWDHPAGPVKHQYKRMPPLPTVSTALSLTASSSHPTEPPSNQMYSSSAARAQDDEDREAAGLDRSWPFVFEGMATVAAFRTSTGKATPTLPFGAGRMVTREAGFAEAYPGLSRREFRATNYFSKANGCAAEPTFLGLRAQQPAMLTKQPALMIPSAHLREEQYCDFVGVMPSTQGSVFASSPSPRPFYSFLPAGPVRCERPLSECRADDVSEGVDLELNL